MPVPKLRRRHRIGLIEYFDRGLKPASKPLPQCTANVAVGSKADKPPQAKIHLCPLLLGDLNRSAQHRGQLAINIDYGLPNARPIGFSDGPRNQLSHNTIFSSALLPLRNHLLIVLDSIFSLSDKVLRRPVELALQ
jgi:hypothetical protein